MARYMNSQNVADSILSMARLNDGDPYRTGYYAGLDRALEIIAAEPTADVAEVKRGEWESVAERLPDRGEYLCTYRGEVFIAEYRNGFWSARSNKIGSALWGVTHWMPIPDPPDNNNTALNSATGKG